MNKFLILLLLLISCNNKAQDNSNIKLLKKAYSEKEEKVFLQNFPENFEAFKSTFGWNDKLNKPNILYHDANNYIDYFFILIANPNYINYKKNIIDIAVEAKWEADAVNYFHMKLQNIVETDKDFVQLLGNLSEKKINSFWRFYFDLENLIYSPKLDAILNNSMRNKSISVFKKIKEERKKENTLDHKQTEYEIFDKDGYVNVRKEKNKSSAIIKKLKINENFEVLDNTGDWWYIETKTGKTGYIHKNRIRIKNDSSAANNTDLQKEALKKEYYLFNDESWFLNCDSSNHAYFSTLGYVQISSPDTGILIQSNLKKIGKNHYEGKYSSRPLQPIPNDMDWKNYSKDEVIIEIKYINNKIEFTWLGFYNTKTKKREYTKNPFTNKMENAPIILKKCD